MFLGREIAVEVTVENEEYLSDYDDLNSAASKEFVRKFEEQVRLMYLFVEKLYLQVHCVKKTHAVVCRVIPLGKEKNSKGH